MLNPNRFGINAIDEDEIVAVTRVLQRRELFYYCDDGELSEARALEIQIGQWFGSPYAISVNSGTAGLKAALQAMGVQAGDRVLISAFTFIATASAALSLGTEVIPVDICDDMSMDLADLKSKIPGAKVVIPVYVAGYASNLSEILDIAYQYGVKVLEDACQGVGVGAKKKRAGTIGHAGVFSFQQHKQLSSGEGGAVLTGNPALAEKIRRYSDHGAVREHELARPDWLHPDTVLGENLRMTEIAAAILQVQLGRLEHILALQRQRREDVQQILNINGLHVVSSGSVHDDNASYLLLRSPSAEGAAYWQQVAREFSILLKPIWNAPFYNNAAILRLWKARKPAEYYCKNAERVAPCLLAMPINALCDDAQHAHFLQAVKNINKVE